MKQPLAGAQCTCSPHAPLSPTPVSSSWAPGTNPAARGAHLPGGTGVCVWSASMQGQPRGPAQEAPGHLVGSGPLTAPERSSCSDALRFRYSRPAAWTPFAFAGQSAAQLCVHSVVPPPPREGPSKARGPSLRDGPTRGSCFWASGGRTRTTSDTRVPRPGRPATVTTCVCRPAPGGSLGPFPGSRLTLLFPLNLCSLQRREGTTQRRRERPMFTCRSRSGDGSARRRAGRPMGQGCGHRAGPLLLPASPTAHVCGRDAPRPGPGPGDEASPAPLPRPPRPARPPGRAAGRRHPLAQCSPRSPTPRRPPRAATPAAGGAKGSAVPAGAKPRRPGVRGTVLAAAARPPDTPFK